jgi:signal peptide peptidase SppA
MNALSNAFKTFSPILIEPAKAKAYLDKVESVPLQNMANDDIEDVLEMLFGPVPVLIKSGSLGIVPVKGVIGSGCTEIEKMMGCVDVEDVQEMIEECERDPNIKTIIFDFDTPGGVVTGVPELASRIEKCSKRTIGWTCKQSCSAGFWLMSQCDEVFVSASSIVGSIGVYIPVYDISEAYDEEGIKVDVIKSGWAKAAGYPGTRMTTEQRKLFEDDVKETHEWFISDVISVRSLAKVEDMQGQCWSGKKAALKMLVSGILDTFDDLLMYIGDDEYQTYERQEPIPASVTPNEGYAADVSPEQGEKDNEDEDDEDAKPISDKDKNDKKKKKKKKPDGSESDEDEEDEEEIPEVPEKDCPPVDTDCK